MVSLPGGHDLGMVPTPRPYESFQQKSPVVSIPVASLAASAASEMEYSSSSSSSSSSFFFFLVFLVFLVFLRPPSDDAPSSLSSSRRKSYSSAAIRSNNLSISGEFSRDRVRHSPCPHHPRPHLPSPRPPRASRCRARLRRQPILRERILRQSPLQERRVRPRREFASITDVHRRPKPRRGHHRRVRVRVLRRGRGPREGDRRAQPEREAEREW